MFVARRGSLLRYAGGTPDPFYDVDSPHFRRLFQELVAAGVEIALHASYRATTADRLRAEKGALEEASGQAVRGNRHHYWHLDPRHPEATLRAHEAAGLGYDTSLTHDHYVGWRRGLSWPFFPFHSGERRGLRTLQIGTAWMDDQLFGMRRCNPGAPTAVIERLVATAVAHGGCLLVDVHDYVFDDTLFPGWRALYEHLLGQLAARGDVWIETPGRVAQHWAERYAGLCAASEGLGPDGGAPLLLV
jgi:hypothetical protein